MQPHKNSMDDQIVAQRDMETGWYACVFGHASDSANAYSVIFGARLGFYPLNKTIKQKRKNYGAS